MWSQASSFSCLFSSFFFWGGGGEGGYVIVGWWWSPELYQQSWTFSSQKPCHIVHRGLSHFMFTVTSTRWIVDFQNQNLFLNIHNKNVKKIPLCNQHDVSFPKMWKSNQLNPLSLLFSQFSSELLLCRPAGTVSRSQDLCFIFLVRRRGK